MRLFALAVCLLCGCDLAFGLTGRVPPDAQQIDSDGDTLFDDEDNCPALANLDQHDEDRDGAGDLCDNCPHVANTSQDNTDGDTLGEACDDSPAIDCLMRFDPFTGPNPPPASNGVWLLEGGDSVVQNDPAFIDGYLLVDPSPRNNPLIITHARVKQTGDPDDYNNLGIWAEAAAAESNPGVPETAFLAEVGRTTIAAPTDNLSAGLHVVKRVSSLSSNSDFPRFSPIQSMIDGSAVDLRLDMRDGTDIRSSARLDGGAELLATSMITALDAGRIGFRTFKLAAAFDYIVIVERRPALPCPARN